MTYFTGIDVSLRSVSICVVDEQGKVCHEAKTAAQPAAIASCLQQFSSDVKTIGLEAGALTQYLTYGLQAARPHEPWWQLAPARGPCSKSPAR